MSSKNKGNFTYALWAILYAILIFILSSLPSSAIPNLGVSFSDLILHFGEYLIFGYFLGMAIMQTSDKVNLKRVLLALMIGTLYAASDEYHQSFVAGRYAEVSDFFADSVGVLFGVAIFVIVRLSRREAVSR